MAEVRELEGGRAPGPIYLHSLVDLAAHGFEELELVVTGEAEGVSKPDEAPAARPYATRILVRRPVDPARFNGTVVVEWLNVTTGFDVEILWCAVREMLMRDGYAWVGVTAQPIGVAAMRSWDPEHYGMLEHPALPSGELPPFVWGETFSDDIFTQVGTLLKGKEGARLFGRAPATVLAHGQSQSSMRLTSYLRDTQPESDTFDGFLLHAGGGTAIRGRPPLPDSPAIGVQPQRARVLKFNSEAEAEGYRSSLQPDSANFVYWEVAGTAHTPVSYIRDTLIRSDHSGMQRDTYEWTNPLGPRTVEYPLRAAVHHLTAWVRDGVRRPPAVPIDMADSGSTIARDEYGNALGGIRLPHVMVPVGRYLAINDGDHRLHPGFQPFDPATVHGLYPDQRSYVARLEDAVERCVQAGFVLKGDSPACVDELGSFDVAAAEAPWSTVGA